MPPKVADWLMSEGANNGREGEDGKKASLQNEGDIKSLFRPFNMHRMEVRMGENYYVNYIILSQVVCNT